jgi:hypothetical protein
MTARRFITGRPGAWLVFWCLLIGPPFAAGQDAAGGDPRSSAATIQDQRDSQPTIEIYGFVEGDAIVDFEQNNPDWYDTLRPSRLPAFADEFGEDGHFYLSPRQSRFGVTSTFPTLAGDVRTNFEFDMIGVGPHAGQTTIRLRHAWGQWKQVGAGQTFSQFMDPDVYPNRLDSWGPNGMPTSRNPQVFWEPYRQGNSNLRIAIENPGVAADGGIFADRIDFPHVRARFPMPDMTGHYRYAGSWGYVQAGGVVLYVAYDDLVPNDPLNLSGHVWGRGVSLSSNVNAGANNLLRLQLVYGRSIENYLNDAPVDVGVKLNPGNATTPIVGEALPVLSMVAYLEHAWAETWSTSAGYSRVDVRNSDGELPSAFRIGQYATANLRCTPVQNVMIGGEFQWLQRRNFSDGWTVNDFRLEFSFKYTFSYKLGRP